LNGKKPGATIDKPLDLYPDFNLTVETHQKGTTNAMADSSAKLGILHIEVGIKASSGFLGRVSIQ